MCTLFVYFRICDFICSLNYACIAFQYERFFQPEATVVASVFAPIMFPPAPVLVYKEKKDNYQVIFSPIKVAMLSCVYACAPSFNF
jgi:hypothetical protein